MEGPGHDAGREAHHRRDRKVDLAADDHERHGQRDNALLDRELEQIDEIAHAEEIARIETVQRDDRDQQREHRRFPASEHRGRAGHRSAPRSFGASSRIFSSERAQRARRRCRMTASLATASKIKRPSTASSQNSLMPSRKRDCSKVPINTAPSIAPATVPEPPKMLTPPTTTAATTLSSRPRPASTVMFPKRASIMKPPRPDSAPQTQKAKKTIAFVGRPMSWAASGLEPIA